MARSRISFDICYINFKIRISWHLDLKVSRAGERERAHPCNDCEKAFKSLQTPNQHKIWQQSSHGKTFKTKNSINRHKKLVC